ncbi:MAG: YfgM family protein [Aestuariibacter sp.]
MDQFSTEEQQVEAIKKFWKENGIAILVGAALGLGGLWGWRYYNEQVLLTQEANSNAYETAIEQLQQDDVNAVKSFIEEKSDSNYAVLAALQLAKEAIKHEDLTEAAKQLQWAAENVDAQEIKDIALVRLARVQNAQEQYDAALTTLSKVTSEAFKAQVHNIKGDVLVNQGKLTEAQNEYAQALALDENNTLLQMKVDDLKTKVNG